MQINYMTTYYMRFLTKIATSQSKNIFKKNYKEVKEEYCSPTIRIRPKSGYNPEPELSPWHKNSLKDLSA